MAATESEADKLDLREVETCLNLGNIIILCQLFIANNFSGEFYPRFKAST